MRNHGNITFYIIFIVLSLFILCVFDIFAAPINLEGLKQIESSQVVIPNNEVIKKPVFVYKAQEARDPFEPYVSEEDELQASRESASKTREQRIERTPPDLKIQGVIWGGNFPQAIINNKVIKIGEVIEEANIKAIDKEGVTFIFEGREYKSGVSAFVAGNGLRK